MKVLTGKANEAFLKHSIGKEISLFETMLPIYQNAIIIEWLDSVGIYVGIETESIDEYGTGFYSYVNECCINEIFISRQQATEQAIIKAVEIYNKRGN